MSNQDRWQEWEQKARHAGAQIEEDLRDIVGYINEEVVPEVRIQGSRALRIAAEKLRELAEHLDKHNRPGDPK